MSKSAAIFTKDNRFARMLDIELSSIGVNVLSEDEKEQYSNSELYTIIDLDSYNISDITDIENSGTIIGFSKREKKEIKDRDVNCSFFFKRPFLTSELLQIFASADDSKAHKSKTAHSHKKLHYLSVDKNERLALWGDLKIPLSENEYRVLTLLCENRGKLVKRERLYSLLGAEDGNMGDVYICHLRRKIDNKLGLKLIYTVRGKGYILKN